VKGSESRKSHASWMPSSVFHLDDVASAEFAFPRFEGTVIRSQGLLRKWPACCAPSKVRWVAMDEVA